MSTRGKIWVSVAIFDVVAWYWLIKLAIGISQYCYCGASL